MRNLSGYSCPTPNNWRTGITLLAADAHFRHSMLLYNKEATEYLRRPDVWSEITSVYDEYLEHCPKDDKARSKYAALCSVSYHHVEANEQFQILGDRLVAWDEWPFYELETLKGFRFDAAFEAKKAANFGVNKKSATRVGPDSGSVKKGLRSPIGPVEDTQTDANNPLFGELFCHPLETE